MPRDGTPALRRIKRRGKLRQTWYIQYHQGGKRHLISTHTRDKEEAETQFAKFLADQNHNAETNRYLATPDRITIRDCLKAYMDDAEQRVKRYDVIENRATNLDDHFGASRVGIITRSTCLGYATARRKTGIAEGTIRSELGVMVAAFRYMVAEGKLTYAPEVWRPEKPRQHDRWLTRSQLAALIRAARHVDGRYWKDGKLTPETPWQERARRWHLPLFILMTYYSAQRSSSVLKLQWQRNLMAGYIDLENRRLYAISSAEEQSRKRRVHGQPIADRLMTFLRYAAKRTRREDSSGYVIEYGGQPTKSLKKSFRGAVKRAGLDKKTTPHTLLHTGITHLLQSGADIYDVAAYVAKSVDVIQRVYAHHSPEHLEHLASLDRRAR